MDPFGWLEGDTYYAIFGGKRPGIAKSPTLEGEWKYVGDLFAHGFTGVSLEEDVSCPDLSSWATSTCSFASVTCLAAATTSGMER